MTTETSFSLKPTAAIVLSLLATVSLSSNLQAANVTIGSRDQVRAWYITHPADSHDNTVTYRMNDSNSYNPYFRLNGTAVLKPWDMGNYRIVNHNHLIVDSEYIRVSKIISANAEIEVSVVDNHLVIKSGSKLLGLDSIYGAVHSDQSKDQ